MRTSRGDLIRLLARERCSLEEIRAYFGMRRCDIIQCAPVLARFPYRQSGSPRRRKPA